MSKIRVLAVAGSAYDMGYIHGKTYARAIGELTEERLRLSCDPFWTGGQQATLDEVLAIGRACLQHHEAFHLRSWQKCAAWPTRPASASTNWSS